MLERSSAILRKLGKGKAALSEQEILEFCKDVGSASVAEIRDALVPKKKTPAKKRPSAPKPEWLIQMEAAKRRLEWSARESVQKLVQVAVDEGLINSVDIFAGRKSLPSFPVAAKTIAANDNGDRLCRVFLREVARIEREYRLG